MLETIKSAKDFAKFEIPKAIYTVKNFTETNTEKVQRLQTLISLGI
ncbi:hypothetical protein KAOT1_03642 [Kordia algicida OT-1]|uniref:Uncharacterized protein n=1 Tax=Kordia algicida OT-1 TaxID=391587 RepID=A9DVV3_9FLAO|nr:hypothetical protein KAOT1_03642 [Kordia algicida OT-1]